LVTDLDISQHAARVLYREQYRWLVRQLEQHEHIDYAPEDCVPFLFVRELGRGSEGTVRVVKNKINQRIFCDKVTRDSPDNRAELTTILKLLDYKHIISIFGSYPQRKTGLYSKLGPRG
jgi:hypothetical protein